MKKAMLFIPAVAGVLALLFCFGCSSKRMPHKPDETVAAVDIRVLKALDSTPVPDANIMLYDADKEEARTRLSSGADGKSFLECDPGNYYVKITAQGYKPLQSVPFSLPGGDTTQKVFYLDTLSIAQPGQINGHVYNGSPNPDNAISGALVKVENNADQTCYSVVSGPDGYYVLFNLPYGDYTITPRIAGYTLASAPTVSISDSSLHTINVTMNSIAGDTLTGSVQCKATSGPDSVDVALMDSAIFSTIPGLTVIAPLASYTITKVPPGRYLAWASFRNDGYVMDPDDIFKQGYPMVEFNGTITSLSKNFTITGAIQIVSPTNPPDDVFPVLADSAVPTFVWTKQSSFASAKEYIIEVKDYNGNILWGGYNRATGAVNHAQITQVADTARIRYNFDGQSVPALRPGVVYQWKLYADNSDLQGVQTLLSSSEDQMGLFMVPAP